MERQSPSKIKKQQPGNAPINTKNSKLCPNEKQSSFMGAQIIKGKKPTMPIISQQFEPLKSKIMKEQSDKLQQIAVKGDERYQVKNPKEFPYSAIGYIQAFKGFEGHSVGTGCLIGPNLVLTAAHNIRITKQQKGLRLYSWSQESYDQREAYFYLGAHGLVKDAPKRLKVKNMYFPNEFETVDKLNDTKQFDYAILELDTDQDLTKMFGCFGITTKWSMKDRQQQVYIFGYAADRIYKKVLEEKLEKNKEYAFLFGEIGHIFDITSDDKIIRYHQISASEGQSGCPIFVQSENGEYYIVGVHRGHTRQQNAMVNIGVKITEQVRKNINSWLASFCSTNLFKQWKRQLNQQQKLESLRLYNEGNKFFRNGNYKQAVNSFQQAIDIDQYSAESFFWLGQSHYQLGNNEEAINCYQSAIKINPNYDTAYNNQGFTYYNLKRYEQAIECYQKAIKINQNDHKAYNNLGMAYYNLKRYEQAIECYQKAIKINQNFHQAYNNLGIAYDNLQRYEQAIECYQKAIKINQNDHLAYNNLGLTYKKLQRYEQAIECYQKAIKINQNYHLAYYNLGSTYDSLQRYEQAIECYQKAIKINQNDHKAYNNLGMAYYNLKRYEQAIECYQKAIKINQNYHQAYHNLGFAYESVGKSELALENAKMSLRIQPNDAYYKARVNKLIAKK